MSSSVLFGPRASRSVLYSLQTFQFSSCNLIMKLESILLYYEYELHFLKVTKVVYDFKRKRKFNLLKALLAPRNLYLRQKLIILLSTMAILSL